MKNRWMAMVAGSVLLAVELVALPAFAKPPCGRGTCKQAINACVASECSGLKGKSRSQCKKECVASVESACKADHSVCNPSTTTVATTSSTSSTGVPTTSTSEAPTTTTLVGSPSGTFID